MIIKESRFPPIIGNGKRRMLRLVKAGVFAAIYKIDSSFNGVPSFDGYEVVTYKEQSFSTMYIHGASVFYYKKYRHPSDEDFGKTAYCYRDFQQALLQFKRMEYGIRPYRYASLRKV